MPRERFTLIPEEKLKDEQIRYQIEQGLITSKTYQSLSQEEQNKVKQVLFEMYSQPIATPVALSAIEFTLMGLVKLFFRVTSGEPLTEKEQAFYERFKQFAEQHEVTLDPDDWYMAYAEKAMFATKTNRAEYKQKKIEITGSF